MERQVEHLAELVNANPLFSIIALASVVGFATFYQWLQPKPLDDFPCNPIHGILGDIPDIMRMTRTGDKNIYDYYAHQVEKFGPVSQVRHCDFSNKSACQRSVAAGFV
jgi:hypothetical protein